MTVYEGFVLSFLPLPMIPDKKPDIQAERMRLQKIASI